MAKAEANAIEQRIGPELRRLREAAGMSVRTLAERAGFSASLVSQIENGQVSPSIAALGQIAATLGVSLADFFAATSEPGVIVVKAGARPSFRSVYSRGRVEALTPVAASHAIEALMVELEPGGSSGKRPASVPREQIAVVFAGRINLETEVKVMELSRGDSAFIPGRTPFRWHNSGLAAAQVLIVSPRRGA
jgi:XRE family transcriptional regulator, regulator of sulfur utilization